MRRSALWLAAGALGVMAAGIATADAAELATAESDRYGTYLTDGEGKALYLFEADRQGTEAEAAASTCSDACAEAWPPLTDEGASTAGEGVDEELIGTIARDDGAAQVTYNGWPLYYYAKDTAPGSTEGQDIEGFGGEWYLVTPEGEEVHAE